MSVFPVGQAFKDRGIDANAQGMDAAVGVDELAHGSVVAAEFPGGIIDRLSQRIIDSRRAVLNESVL